VVEEIYYTDVKQICQSVLSKYNVDFTGMASTSFRRRIVKAMNTSSINSVGALIEKLEASEVFFQSFCKDLIVDNTEFFRDPSFWRKMKEEVLPRYVSQASVRIWLPGCASGEELFSLCIMLKEQGLLDKSRIIASEISDKIFDRIRLGQYPIKNMEIALSNYERFEGKFKLENYYKEVGGSAIFDSSLLKVVTFKKNFLGREDIGSSFDLIVCRNNLLYYGNALQDSALSMMVKNLFKGGFLAVGIKEDISISPDYLTLIVVSQEEKIYAKK